MALSSLETELVRHQEHLGKVQCARCGRYYLPRGMTRHAKACTKPHVIAHVETRSQRSRGSGGNQFGGPDRYVAVQVVPEGSRRLEQLRHDIAEKRNIKIIWIGEGYSQHTGPRSSLGQAMAEAEALADTINSQPGNGWANYEARQTERTAK